MSVFDEKQKPIIGIISLYDDERASQWMLPGYVDGIVRAGGVPVVFPLGVELADVERLCTLCSGFLLTGGHDVSPALYHEKPLPECGLPCPDRDELERRVLAHALQHDKAVLGICRGIQLMNALYGGTLYQDLPTERPSAVDHHMHAPYDRACHGVRIIADTPLHRLLKVEHLGVNSYHHQAIRELAPALTPMAYSDDGLCEAVYDSTKRFVWGVQWHPEYMYMSDESEQAILRAFVGASHCAFQ